MSTLFVWVGGGGDGFPSGCVQFGWVGVGLGFVVRPSVCGGCRCVGVGDIVVGSLSGWVLQRWKCWWARLGLSIFEAVASMVGG